MLSACDAFKVAFLARCVEAQLSPAEMHAQVKHAHVLLDLVEKRAFLGGLVGNLVSAGKGLGEAATPAAIAALAAPPVLGGLAGYGLARGTDISDTDVEEIKDKEVMDEYQRQTQRLRRQRALRSAAAVKPRFSRALI